MRRTIRIGARLVTLGIIGMGGLVCLAEYRWRARTRNLLEELDACSPAASSVSVYTEHELAGLPVPVQRYFRAVLQSGQTLPAQARFGQEGRFLLQPQTNGWRPFTATQYFFCGGAGAEGFVWDARIFAAPGVAVRVRDAFACGVGHMEASVMGLVPVVDVEGTPEIAAGALHRYLAEAVWCPTALLPSQGVTWTALDDTSARASLCSGKVTVSLDFHFGADGLVRRVFTAARARAVDGISVPTPWQGRFFDYGERSGMLIPLRGEVEWLLPDGPQLYWRGRITKAVYSHSKANTMTPICRMERGTEHESDCLGFGSGR